MVENMPGTTNVDVRDDDLLYMLINTVDNRLDDVIGIRPIRAIARVATTVAPANAINNLTGMDKPSEVVERLMDDAEKNIKNKSMGRLF